MGLEFKNVENLKEVLFIIDDVEFGILEKKVFEDFNKKYNHLIDLDSDFRLHENHLKHLYELFYKLKPKTDFEINFMSLLKTCISNEITLLVKGN